jgi:hypothetical protein
MIKNIPWMDRSVLLFLFDKSGYEPVGQGMIQLAKAGQGSRD